LELVLRRFYARHGKMFIPKWSIPSLHTPDHFASRVVSLQFSSDSCRLVSTGSDRVVRVWDVETGKPVSAMDGLVDVVRMAWLPPNKLLVGGHSYIALLNLETLREERRWIAHWGWVYGIEVSEDANWFLSIGLDRKLKYWDVNAEAPLTKFGQVDVHCPVAESEKYKEHPQALAWSRTTNICAFATRSLVRLWDVNGKMELQTLRGHRQEIWGLDFTAEGRWLASAGMDKTVRVWNPSDGREVACLKGHAARINALTSIPGTHVVATADSAGEIRLWSLDEMRQIGETVCYDNREYGLNTIDASPNGKYLAAGGYGGTISLWEFAAG
jgi:WD40 repeat protein